VNWEQQTDYSSAGYEWVIRNEANGTCRAIVWYSDNHKKWVAVSDWDGGRPLPKGATAEEVMDQVMAHFVQWRMGV
jgi:hypothetical protein